MSNLSDTSHTHASWPAREAIELNSRNRAGSASALHTFANCAAFSVDRGCLANGAAAHAWTGVIVNYDFDMHRY